MKVEPSRRDFLKTSVGVGALLGFPTIIPSSVLGKNGAVAPSNRAAIAVLGCGGQSAAARSYVQYDKSEVVAVCDPIKERRDGKAATWGVDLSNSYEDFRDVLARDDIDGVHIAAGDYWHVPMSIAAAKAGKDIYCEKPLGLTIEESLAAKQITEKYDRIFQYGTQQRSQLYSRRGLEVILNGHLGEVKEVYASAGAGQKGGSGTPVLDVPDGYNLDLWTGPAPIRPFSHDRNIDKRGIWFIYDYAIGFMAGTGSHSFDNVQWWLDHTDAGMPLEVKGKGTIPTEGLFDTVTHWDVEYTYANGTKLTFQDSWTMGKTLQSVTQVDKPLKFGFKSVFIGSEGWIGIGRGGWAYSDNLKPFLKDPGPIRLHESKNHRADFVDSILSREQPVATLDSAIRSDISCHIGEIAIRTGETLGWDTEKQEIIGSDAAKKRCSRPRRAPFDQLS